MKIGGCIKTIVPLYLKVIEKLIYTAHASEFLYLDCWLLGRSNLVLFSQIKKDKWTLEIDKHLEYLPVHCGLTQTIVSNQCKVQISAPVYF